MTSTSFTQLIPAAARQAHSDLVEALGSETNPAQCMDFMETVTRLLPDVLSVGRPSKDAIQRGMQKLRGSDPSLPPHVLKK